MPKKKNPAAVSLGRLGGKAKGVKKGFAALSPERLQEIRAKGLEKRRKKSRKP